MDTLLRAAERIPNPVRVLAIAVLPVLAFVTASFRSPLTVALFLVWSAVTLAVHAPVFVFDGPLPFSDAGVHAAGRVHDWDEIVAVEPLGDKDLQAVLADGDRLKLRVRGRRSRGDFREALARHKPEALRF
jgi:hypothetical protein